MNKDACSPYSMRIVFVYVPLAIMLRLNFCEPMVILFVFSSMGFTMVQLIASQLQPATSSDLPQGATTTNHIGWE